MNATFITQNQFNETNACMLFMESIDPTVSDFNQALELGLRGQLANPPYREMRAGQTQARLWKLKSGQGVYEHTHGILNEAANFADYLTGQIRALSSADKRLPVSHLVNITPPSGPRAMYDSGPAKNCRELLSYHQQWINVLAEFQKATDSDYAALRTGINASLSRVFDYMALHLQPAQIKKPQPARIQTARRHTDSTRKHHRFGMDSIANFLAQQQRIMTLVTGANRYMIQLDNAASVSRLGNDLKLAGLEIRQAQRFCAELAALRSA
jgi:hypothetical protein